MHVGAKGERRSREKGVVRTWPRAQGTSLTLQPIRASHRCAPGSYARGFIWIELEAARWDEAVLNPGEATQDHHSARQQSA
jgi:hypothetical protein